MYALLNYRLFIFPPWFIFWALKGEPFRRKPFSSIFVIIWFFCQWVLLISSGSNILVSIVSANISMLFLFVANINWLVNKADLDEEEIKSLRSIPMKILSSLLMVFMMYAFFELPQSIFDRWSFYGMEVIKQSIEWTPIYMLFGIILIGSWIVFVFVDDYDVFQYFPRTDTKKGFYINSPLDFLPRDFIFSIYSLYVVALVIVVFTSARKEYSFINKLFEMLG